MKQSNSVLALALLALAAAGCRAPEGFDAMERELRYQEDMIYQLQDYIRTYKSHLHACRTENESLRSQTTGTPTLSSPDAPEEIGPGRPDVQLPDSNGVQPPRIELPDFSRRGGTPNGAQHQTVKNAGASPPMASGGSVEKAGADKASNVEPVDFEEPAVAVARLTLNTDGTGAFGDDDESDSSGIVVVLEPRSANDEIVPTDAEIVIAVVAPDDDPLHGKRLAHWPISPKQLSEGQTPAGIKLELPWPDSPPAQTDVLIFADLVTPDGLHLYADHRIDLTQKLIRRPQHAESLPAEQSAPAVASDANPKTETANVVTASAVQEASEPVRPVAAKSSPVPVPASTPTIRPEQTERKADVLPRDPGQRRDNRRTDERGSTARPRPKTKVAKDPPARSAEIPQPRKDPPRPRRARPQWAPYR